MFAPLGTFKSVVVVRPETFSTFRLVVLLTVRSANVVRPETFNEFALTMSMSAVPTC